MFNRRSFWHTTLLAWLVFIGIDFFFHASLLEALWKEDIAMFRSSRDLFVLIPVGYLSFFLLTLLLGYVFVSVFKGKPNRKEAASFALVFSSLYATSNLLGLYSYVDIPLFHLITFHLVYFIEISAVIYIFYRASFLSNFRKLTIYSLLTFFGLVISGIVIQNIL